MKFAISLFSVLSIVVTGALGQGVTMNTPTNLVTCQPVQLTWMGGTAPYFVSIQDGNNPSGAALQQFPPQNGTAVTWTVNIPPNTRLVLLLRDSNGQTSLTAPITVQPGSSTDCVGKAASVSGGGTNTGGTGQPTNTNTQATTGAGTATNTQTGGNTGTTATKTGTGTSGAATNSSNAASSNVEFGAAGIVGAALVALLA
ncbi:hypothetical protein E1B28_011251 [Marasmius oreades]|uniref:Secreted protein n=1 Tax=Marasmius oreades TaxID=181124 RepID=A0A9P7URW3_9AGAR|nr:uncharacterized protein E1B28_011251 [Marasmius oreades]KAG7089584.1 hypothetical protein E1B28_011251 [Marasmius oreades]